MDGVQGGEGGRRGCKGCKGDGEWKFDGSVETFSGIFVALTGCIREETMEGEGDSTGQ